MPSSAEEHEEHTINSESLMLSLDDWALITVLFGMLESQDSMSANELDPDHMRTVYAAFFPGLHPA
jgi:hypothetical protein